MEQTNVRDIVAELAATGVLRAGINMGNGLLVTGMSAAGDPQGVAPDMAAEIARRLGVPVAYVKFERPSQLADAAGTNAWDIGLIGAEPARAEKIAFTAGLLRDRSHVSRAAGLAVPKSRRRRPPGHTHRGLQGQRL
jgi:ABC-type amino acid transport substrate-binding protein